MKKTSLVLSLILLASACSSHRSTYAIGTANLLNSSLEKISFPLTDNSSIDAITSWIKEGETPSSADIACGSSGKACDNLKKLLTKQKIAINEIESDANSPSGNVSLIYNRLIARNCNPTMFGCATAVNSIQMVTNRGQFIKPAMLDPHDAATATKAINKLRNSYASDSQ